MSEDLWKYTLRPEDEGKKYEEILKRRLHFSRHLVQGLKQGERAWVNGRFTFLSARGHAGETLALALQPEETTNIEAEPLPLRIIYEDDYLLAVNKSCGQVVHPTPRYPHNTLGNAVAWHWQSQGQEHIFRPIHRIDRNTSGLVLIAKNRFAHQQLAWQLEHSWVQKRYLGFVSGQIAEDNGQIDGPLRLVPGSFILRQVHPQGQKALTFFRVLRRYPAATLLEFDLKTGRTHQIRVHCQAMGHPLLGDDLYGGDTALIGRQALHSFSYSFSHPADSRILTLRAPWPADLLDLTRALAL
ncbi:ribosomal large subunit pseudouridine synthase D [Peptococcaceae bacterium CEB3]|nr:ribosomal large subunit pseudouridine synthase D [Peptococcaceae bacterium CEB3]